MNKSICRYSYFRFKTSKKFNFEIRVITILQLLGQLKINPIEILGDRPQFISKRM